MNARHRTGPFTAQELGIFGAHAILMAVIGGVMCAIASSLSGRVASIVLAVLLIPVPPLAIYALRRRRAKAGHPRA